MRKFQRRKNNHLSSYDRLSPWYDLLSWPSEKKATLTGIQFLAPMPGERALEIGCGTGRGLRALANQVGATGSVVGLDLSAGMLRASQSRISRIETTRPIYLTLADARLIPYPAGVFDLIFLSFTLELFENEEIPRVLGECRRVLKPGGRIGVVSLSKANRWSVQLYEWFHARFPKIIDCHPIPLISTLEQARFQAIRTTTLSMWGLPVEIVLAKFAP